MSLPAAASIVDGQAVPVGARRGDLALVAGMVTRMVLFPAGALANVPLVVRSAPSPAASRSIFALRRNLAVGVVGGGPCCSSPAQSLY